MNKKMKKAEAREICGVLLTAGGSVGENADANANGDADANVDADG